MSISLILLFVLNRLSWALSCADITSADSCASADSCEWDASGENCLAPDCSGTTTEIACESLIGCFWSEPEAGYCGSPDDTACIGSSTCGVGCLQNPASGFCSRPSSLACEKLSSQPSCEVGNNGCVWHPSRGSCTYEDPNCRILDHAACSSTIGCMYYSNKGSCQQPDYDSCDSFSTPDTCNRGCKWYPASGSCSAPYCYSLTPTECAANAAACEYRPAICIAPSCSGKTPSECDAEGSGCEWIPNSYQCIRPSQSNCYNLDKAACSSSASGCSWYVYNEGGCRYNYQCQNLSETECKASNSGCNFRPARSECRAPDDTDCQCFTKSECETASNGCQWDVGYGHCQDDNGDYCEEVDGNCGDGCYWKIDQHPYCRRNYYGLNCVGNSEGNECSTESQQVGCKWKPVNSSCETKYDIQCVGNSEGNGCSTPSQQAGCKWSNEQGYCQENYELECLNNVDNTGCATTSTGCKWTLIRGNCTEKDGADEITCITKDDGSGCTAGSDPKCIYQTNEVGCRWKNNNYPQCYNDACTPNACNSSSDAGCVWQGNPARCRVSDELRCVTNADYSGCDSTSSPFCRWSPGSEGCQNVWSSDSYVVCYDNAAKNGCDRENSDSECNWVDYPAYCSRVDNLECYDNDASTACKTGSSPSCKWLDVPASCDTNWWLYCVNNSARTGCDLSYSDAGCVWHAATTTGTCNRDDGIYCTPNATNTGCADYSTYRGCTWKSGGLCKDKGGKGDKGSSSVVFVPLLGVFLLFVFLL